MFLSFEGFESVLKVCKVISGPCITLVITIIIPVELLGRTSFDFRIVVEKTGTQNNGKKPCIRNPRYKNPMY